MRLFGFVPILLTAAALVLTFLCLFAGHQQGVLEHYQVLTVNVSQIGEQVFLQIAEGDSTVQQLLGALPDNVQSAIAQGVNTAAQQLGIPEFYQAHIMTVCEGNYDPQAVPSDAVSRSDISRDVTSCSTMRAGYRFDPREQVQESLDERGLSIDVSQLGWPQELDDALSLIEPITLGAFILYVANCAIIFISLCLCIVALFASGRGSACCNVGFSFLALLVSAATSAIMTVIAVLGPDLINQYGQDFGVSATGGTNFLILTWVATGCLLVTCLMWCVDCCCLSGRRQRRSSSKYG